MSAESLDSAGDGVLPSGSLAQEPPYKPLGLAGDVELSEQPIIVDGIAEETAVIAHPTDSSSSPLRPKTVLSTDVQVSQGSAGLVANGFTLKGNETRAAVSGYVAPTVQGDGAQVVAIIPTQVRRDLFTLGIKHLLITLMTKSLS